MRQRGMNWYTACAYQPDCLLRNESVSAPNIGAALAESSYASVPSCWERKYSPCSFRFCRVEFPRGAHLRTPSTIQTFARPVKLLVAGVPSEFGSSKLRLRAEVLR